MSVIPLCIFAIGVMVWVPEINDNYTAIAVFFAAIIAYLLQVNARAM